MTPTRWPDPLQHPQPQQVQQLLTAFWTILANLPDFVARGENLLAMRCTAELRAVVLNMMLALNGIDYPQETRHLNAYLGESQRAAIERTLIAATPGAESWIGQAVALVVIYRWYAPQLVQQYNLVYPTELETEVWQHLLRELPDWPAAVTTS